MRSRLVAPRASRTALIAASVPELTRRTCSIDGNASTISAASSTSRSVDAPYVVPSAAARTASTVSRVRVAEDERPERHHPVDVALAVGLLEVRAFPRRTNSGSSSPTAFIARTGD